MVLPDRIELSTSPLPMECSTTELRQHARGNRIGPKAPTGGRFLPQGPLSRKREGGVWRGQNGPKLASGAMTCLKRLDSGPIRFHVCWAGAVSAPSCRIMDLGRCCCRREKS